MYALRVLSLFITACRQNLGESRMECYLCNSSENFPRPGSVRDYKSIKILECSKCGLVFLSEQDQIYEDFYQNSGMHGEEPLNMNKWLADSKHDDDRRFRL